MKRTIAMILAVVMILALSLSTVVFADDSATTAATGSITVTNAQPGETYTAYKMFDLAQNADLSAFTYTVNDAWKGFFIGENAAGAKFITVNDADAVTEIKDAKGNVTNDAKDLAKAAAAVLNGKTPASSAVATGSEDLKGTAFITGLEPGYYLITSSNGTIAMIDTTPTDPAQTIEEKNPIPEIDKTVKEDSTETFGDENDAQIGDTVEFKTEVKVKKGALNYVLHDVMDDGLTLDTTSFVVKVGNTTLTNDTDYTVSIPGSTVTFNDEEVTSTFDVKFAQTYLNAHTDEEYTITVYYNAVLNDKAVVTSPELNDTMLTWGNKSKTAWDETKTYTYQIALHKYAEGKSNEYLAGAVFQLKKGEGENAVALKLVQVPNPADKDDKNNVYYRLAVGDETGVDSFTTVSTGKIVIYGLDNDNNDTYTFVETAAPDGYNVLTEPVPITVGEENGFIANVENKTGTELPSTGGVGTTLLVTFGALLFMTTAVVLVTKKRMYNEGC